MFVGNHPHLNLLQSETSRAPHFNLHVDDFRPTRLILATVRRVIRDGSVTLVECANRCGYHSPVIPHGGCLVPIVTTPLGMENPSVATCSSASVMARCLSSKGSSPTSSGLNSSSRGRHVIRQVSTFSPSDAYRLIICSKPNIVYLFHTEVVVDSASHSTVSHATRAHM